MVPWRHGTMVRWYQGTLAPCYDGTMVLWYHGTSTVQCYQATMLPCYHELERHPHGYQGALTSKARTEMFWELWMHFNV